MVPMCASGLRCGTPNAGTASGRPGAGRAKRQSAPRRLISAISRTRRAFELGGAICGRRDPDYSQIRARHPRVTQASLWRLCFLDWAEIEKQDRERRCMVTRTSTHEMGRQKFARGGPGPCGGHARGSSARPRCSRSLDRRPRAGHPWSPATCWPRAGILPLPRRRTLSQQAPPLSRPGRPLLCRHGRRERLGGAPSGGPGCGAGGADHVSSHCVPRGPEPAWEPDASCC